jgi:hypothetical protein
MAKVATWLFIESEKFTADEISQFIGIVCDRSWRKGAIRGKIGKKYPSNSWQLGSAVEVNDDSEEILAQIKTAISDIINRIRGNEDKFRSVASKEISGLLVGITAKDIPAIVIDANIIKGISSLGIDLEIDLTLVGSIS